jgi:hypothetical protein
MTSIVSTPPMSGARSGGGSAASAASLIVYAALAAAIGAYLFRIFGLFDRFPGNLSDARFNQAVLEHLWLWASGRADSLADPSFFYPYRDILYFSDTHFGTGLVYVLARALGAARETAFDIWYLVGLAATFAATMYVFRRFGAGELAAAVGATLFTFSLPLLAHDLHAQLVYRFAVPLASLALLRALHRPSLRDLLWLVLWVAWQFLCSIYIGVFLVEWLALIAAVAWLRPSWLPRLPQHDAEPTTPLPALAVVAALLAALAGFMLLRHAQVAHAYAIKRDMWEIEQLAPRWWSLLTMVNAPSVGWLTEFLPRGAYWEWEHQLFPGLGAIGLAAAGVRLNWRDDNGRRVIALCFVAMLGLLLPVMDFGGYGLYRYFADAPGFNAIRNLGRVVIVMQFPLAWLAVLGLDSLQRSRGRWARPFLIASLGLALIDIATFRPHFIGLPEARARIAAITAGLDPEAMRAKRAVLMHFTAGGYQFEKSTAVDLMLAAEEMGVRSINGYSGSDPALYRDPKTCAEARAIAAGIDALPYKRPGADDVAARIVILPLGACDAAQ